MQVSLRQTPLHFSGKTGLQDRLSGRAAHLYDQSFDLDKMPKRQANWQRLQFYGLMVILGASTLVANTREAIANRLRGRTPEQAPE